MNRGMILILTAASVLAVPAAAQEHSTAGSYGAPFRNVAIAAFDRAVGWQSEAASVELSRPSADTLAVRVAPPVAINRRLAVRPAASLALPRIARSVRVTVEASQTVAVSVELILRDDFGVEYRLPVGGWTLPTGEVERSAAIPPFISQGRFETARGAALAGLDLIPRDRLDAPVTITFGEIGVVHEPVLRDADAPEVWE